MYFSGKIEIDPTQMTLIKRVKPSKLFGKLIDALSFGHLSEKQEHETFTALSIIQQLNMGLKNLNIKNIIRLAVDDYDFYLDESGQEDDLGDAMFELKAKIDPLESEIFKTIYLVLEHIDDSFKYLIEIGVERKHKVGDYPIKIKINGVLNEFKLREGETREQLEKRMQPIFSSQSTYENYIDKYRGQFEHFIDEIELGIRKVIKVDDVKKDVTTQIIRPKRKVTKPDEIKHEHHTQPLFFGYYGLNDYFFYSMVWAGAMYDSNLYVNNINLVDETGHEIMSVYDDGFFAADSNTFNEEMPFEAPVSGDVRYYDDNAFSDELHDANLIEVDSANGEAPEDDFDSDDYTDYGSNGFDER